MKAVIMAGGQGTRLRPLTCELPKPLVPIVNRPVMEHIIDHVKKFGIDDIVATLYYRPDKIRDYFGDGEEFGVHMQYFTEDEKPLGTAGSVKNAEEVLDDTFCIISGDALTDIDLAQALEFHRKRGAMATLILTRVETPLDYGVVITDEDGRITRFLEKPGWGEVFSDTVNTGIYLLEPEVLDYIPPGEKFDFSQDLFPQLLENREPLFGYVARGYWSDVGNIDEYRQANKDCLAGKVEAEIPGQKIGEGIWAERGASISPQSELRPPVLIGGEAEVREGTEIGPYTVLGAGSSVGPYTSAKRTQIWTGAAVGKKCELRGAVLCEGARVRDRCLLFEGTAVGRGSIIGSNSELKPQVKIWPEKEIKDGSSLTSSLIWGTRWERNLFGADGVQGRIGTDISPRLSSRLAAAYASTLEEGELVGLTADGFPPSQMLKHAVASGLLSAGLRVKDLDQIPTPVFRHVLRSSELKGGIRINLFARDPEQVRLLFLDALGLNISRSRKKKIRRILKRDNFRRTSPEKIMFIDYMPETQQEYVQKLLSILPIQAIRDRRFSLLLDYDEHNLGSTVAPLLQHLGCHVERITSEELSGRVEPRNFSRTLDHMPDLAEMVVETQADLGVIMDNSGEELYLIDEAGSPMGDEELQVLTTYLQAITTKAPVLVSPVSAPEAVEKVTEHFGRSVERTKTDPHHIMQSTLENDIFCDRKQIFPFYPIGDAILPLAKLLEVMAIHGLTLRRLRELLPPVHLIKRKIPTSWETKGRMMREFVRENREKNIKLIDGVKVFDEEGWTLVLPDDREACLHLYCEADSYETAEELADIYTSQITTE